METNYGIGTGSYANERDGSHRPTTQADLELYGPLLERCEAVPWILETVIA